ncbi:unnamed protein product [Acanthoscelides obtectus]|uniref:Adenosine kinase n=1 Tax=Acanthoscelides obtectus TaxID=200917 RepID=A0A9P0LK47_ACAOB|nr:unnamed protein product [Acanthoscelides obtectus]CAK1630224.1 Adenosine kinase 1 [Acanthoscelides obtectus]
MKLERKARVMNWICGKRYRIVFAGAVGDDTFGHLIKGKFEEEKIHHHLVEVKNERTGVCAVLLTGQYRTLVSRLGASKCFTKENLDKHMWGHLQRAQFIYISAFFLGVSFEVIKDIFSHFKENSKTVIVNLAATFLSNDYPKEITYLFEHGDIVFGNENEYKAFLAIHDRTECNIEDILPKLNKIFNKKPDRLLVMTRGSKPLYVLHQTELQEFPVSLIVKEDIVDSNGAGDAFVGGFLAQYVHGGSPNECVRCGTWAAREVLQHNGCSFDMNKVYDE